MAHFEREELEFNRMMLGRTKQMDLLDAADYFSRQLDLYFPEIARQAQFFEPHYGSERKPHTCLVTFTNGQQIIFTADPTKQYGMVEELCR